MAPDLDASTCPIWGIEADIDWSGDRGIIDCPLTAGRYEIVGSAEAMLRASPPSPADAAKLTTWIVEQRLSGDGLPRIYSDTIEQVRARRPLRMSERKQQFFLAVGRSGFRPSDHFQIAGTTLPKLIRDQGKIAAWTSSLSVKEAISMLRLYEEEGLVKFSDTRSSVKLSAKGFEFVESLETAAADSSQAFVAMWFDGSMDAAYDGGFQRAIQDAGYRPLRIDRKEHANKIDDEIIAEIKRSRFVVADFTCGLVDTGEAIARGGVYFEAGYALGMGLPVIWTCRSDCIGKVHFDTRQFAHVVWSDPADLRAKLLTRIAAVIGLTTDAPAQSMSRLAAE